MWIINDFNNNYLVILCGIFYSILCIFSIVTGLIYASGKKKLNPIELSDKFVAKLDSEDKLIKFTKKMGIITIIVGIIQGLTSLSIFKGYSTILYIVSISFTLFSILSASIKLKNKINMFPIIKLIFYIIILVVLIINNSLFI